MHQMTLWVNIPASQKNRNYVPWCKSIALQRISSRDLKKSIYRKPVIIASVLKKYKMVDENKIACTTSATLTITSGFQEMAVGQITKIEILGTTLTVKGAAGVIMNGAPGDKPRIGRKSYTREIFRKTAIIT